MAGPQPQLIEAATHAWAGLSRAIRTVTLYDPEHPQVRPWIERAMQALHRACDYGEPVVFEIRSDDILVGRRGLARRAAVRPELLSRLHADGVRQIHVRSTLDMTAVSRFVAIMAPYQSAAQAPLDSVADRLHWQPLTGLTFVIHARGTITADATTAAEQEWKRRLLAPRVMPGPEHLPERTRLAAVWDGTRGRIPWPPPVVPGEIRALEGELEQADQIGVPVLRIGKILVAALELLAGRPEFAVALAHVETIVDQLLADDLPDEASHLLQPLARWSARPGRNPRSQAARRESRDFLQLLVAHRRLETLLDGAQRGAYTPEQLAAWFAAMPPGSMADLLRFAAAVPVGPHRQALLGVAAYLCSTDTAALERVMATGRPGPALLALEVATGLDDRGAAARVVGLALRRNEQAILVRAIGLAMHLDRDEVHVAMVELYRQATPDVRVQALRHLARFEVASAAELLEEVATSSQFSQLLLAEQLLVCQTLGAIAGERAVELARRRLGGDWRISDPLRCAPWILCLAAAGAEEAPQHMAWLEGRATARLTHLVTECRFVWEEARTRRRGQA